jgi:hypothetical protein
LSLSDRNANAPRATPKGRRRVLGHAADAYGRSRSLLSGGEQASRGREALWRVRFSERVSRLALRSARIVVSFDDPGAGSPWEFGPAGVGGEFADAREEVRADNF